jgi:DNA-binding NarL/FixJ family response regulator
MDAGNTRNIMLLEETIPANEMQSGIRSLRSAYFAGSSRSPERGVRLTPRELEVLSLLAEGLSNKLICRRLGISPGTVKIHVSRVLAELGVSSRLEAVVVGQRLGVLRIDASAAESRQHQRADRLPGDPRPYEHAPPGVG